MVLSHTAAIPAALVVPTSVAGRGVGHVGDFAVGGRERPDRLARRGVANVDDSRRLNTLGENV